MLGFIYLVLQGVTPLALTMPPHESRLSLGQQLLFPIFFFGLLKLAPNDSKVETYSWVCLQE
jgi:hypothetical protein